MSFREKLARVLPRVTKPQRYVGEELHAVKKDLSRADVTLALAFPEIYEIGMSHVGFGILYHLCNRREDVAAERVYCPWPDMEEAMRREHIPLFSLESKTPLSQFDVIGFSLQSEFTYTNVLTMIDLAGCPVFARERDSAFPLIIAGGPCTANPEPLSDFIDAFLIGDGEELLMSFLDRVKYHKEKKTAKPAMLLDLSGMGGVYVPSLYEFRFDGPKMLDYCVRQHGVPLKVQRQYIGALAAENYPDKPLVSSMEITHDRLSLEIMRGCTQGCRFCQAGFWYRPVREMALKDVVDLARRGIERTGLTELNLCSLSTADYSGIRDLTEQLKAVMEPKGVSVALPSLRADSLSVQLADNVASVRRSGFTFAPEAGSWRLRKVINKCITNEQMLEAVDIACQKGWDAIKLYVMVGLPSETQADLEELADVVQKIHAIGKRYRGPKKLTVSIGAFVPKAFTPFQWEGLESLEVLKERLSWLKRVLESKNTVVKWHSLEASLIECVLSRGDRRLGQVIYRVWKDGGRYDGWSQYFDFARWQSAFGAGDVKMEWFLRPLGAEEPVPWDVIDAGVTKKYLLAERQKAFEGALTTDCKWGDCHHCGIRNAPKDIVLAQPGGPQIREKTGEIMVADKILPRETGQIAGRTFRMKFAKKAPLRYLSHLDLMRMIEMILRRAAVPMVYTQGFHRRPKMHFGPSLPLGLTSVSEWVDFELMTGGETGWEGAQGIENLMKRLSSVCPPGFEILELHLLKGQAPSLSARYGAARYDIVLGASGMERLEAPKKIREFLDLPEFWIEEQREKRVRRLDLRKAVRAACIREDKIDITCSINDPAGNNANPYLFLTNILTMPQEDARALDICRVELVSSI